MRIVADFIAMAPPEVPGGRLTVLRRAFDAMVSDPEFLAHAKARQMDIEPMTGEELNKRIQSSLAVPEAIVQPHRQRAPANKC